MSDKLLFYCRVCGVEVGVHGIDTNAAGEEVAVQGVCEEHCEDHLHEYDRGRRGTFCRYCDHQREDEPWEDDVPIFSSPSPEPIGTPISELSGRPGHDGYEDFVRIASSWGHN